MIPTYTLAYTDSGVPPPRKRFDHVLGTALGHQWAIVPAMAPVVAAVLARHIAGVPRAADPVFIPRDPATSATTGGIALVPVHGVIAPHMNMMSDLSGGTSCDEVAELVRTAAADPTVGTIVLDIDSPGGSVAGVTELAAEIRRARTIKPVVACANYQMCSAAYWIGASGTRIVASPSSLQGSIGAFAIHKDVSAALEQLGIKVTLIAAGEHKTDCNEFEPLSDTGRARLQSLVDDTNTAFVTDVAAGRNTTTAAIRAWKADVYTAAEALAIGMVDDIATLDATIATLLMPSVTARARDTRASMDAALFELELL